MNLPYDCIAGYHMNYLTCGIAKFNLVLGSKMGIPFMNLYNLGLNNFRAPLLSVKLSEFTKDDLVILPEWIDRRKATGGYSVFLHGYNGMQLEDDLLRRANAVYCGNRVLYEQLSSLNDNTFSLFCPGTNLNRQLFKETELKIFSFGMAHKLKTEKYYRLKELLDKTKKTYSILLSTALHEGASFDESFIEVSNEMQDIFGNRVYFLGYLSDQAVYNYLQQSDFFVAFFDDGVRANNTSVNTALESGCVVVTNLDEYSPEPLEHMTNIIDINQAEEFPVEESKLERIKLAAKEVGDRNLGWETLLKYLGDRETLRSYKL